MNDAVDPIPLVTRDDPAAHSGDVVAENVAALKAMFPSIVSDGRVDLEVLRQLLGDNVEEGEERYGLNWKGKKRARAFALTPSLGTLLPAKEDSVDWDRTENIVVEGDNLEILKLLRKSYAGRVKLIYIDPPYNTGNDFVYPDDYRDSIGNYERLTGQRSTDGVQMTSDREVGGRLHTNWLNMLYPRLLAGSELLSNDGVIAISIDENELANTLTLCDTVFGEECLLGVLAVQLNPRGRHLDRFLARTHEYVCLYAKDPDNNPVSRIAKDERMTAEYRKSDDRGKYREIELRNRNPAFNRLTRPNLYYPIYVNPNDGSVSIEPSATHNVRVLPKNSEGGDSCWTWSRDKLDREKEVVTGRAVSDGSYRIYRKDYLLGDDGKSATTLPKSLWTDKEINNDIGKKRVQELFGESVFSFPKSPALIRKIIEVCAPSGSTVLDFFAGSGTTGDAVMIQNAADGGARRFIVVQLQEPLDADDKDQKTAAEFCDKIGRPRNIAELTKERLRRAGAKVRERNSDVKVDVGFRVYKLATSNLKPWQPDLDNLEASLLDAVDNVLPGRTEDDLLVELLLKTGIDLTLPGETRAIAGNTVHALGGGVLIVCLGDIPDGEAEALGQGICDWRDELDPPRATTFYFKDSGFETAATKANLAAIIRQRLGKAGVEKLASI